MAVLHFHVFILAGEILLGTSAVLCHYKDPTEKNIFDHTRSMSGMCFPLLPVLKLQFYALWRINKSKSQLVSDYMQLNSIKQATRSCSKMCRRLYCSTVQNIAFNRRSIITTCLCWFGCLFFSPLYFQISQNVINQEVVVSILEFRTLTQASGI